MTRSMTGFGKAVQEYEGETITAELNGVNHRFLDCSIHLPVPWSALEPAVRETVRAKAARGKVNLWITRTRTATAQRALRLNEAVAKQYIDASKRLAHLLGSMETLSLDTLIELDGVLVPEDPEEDLERTEKAVVAVVDAALDAFTAMRAKEGAALAEDCRERIGAIGDALALVEERLPELASQYETRLRTRLTDLQANTDVTEERLAIELALLADKGDVNEEVVRLKTHMDHVLELLESDEPVGRELNFLTQELQREINTLGSKVRDGDVSREAMRMKSELEKFREQVQNIE